MPDWEVEVLLDAPTTSEVTLDPLYDIEVVLGDAATVGELPGDLVIEVVDSILPDANAYIETYEFTRQGPLSVAAGVTELPIAGGTFVIDSIAARVSDWSVGSSIILDIKKNGASIFSVTGNRPTISAGSKLAVVGSWNVVSFTTGDYLTIDIVQVGSSTPGSNLVVPIRLCKIS